MQNTSLGNNGYAVYPGAFVPILNEEEIRNTFQSLHTNGVTHPKINFKETQHELIIDVVIPGVKREEFLLNTDDNVLSVSVIHSEHETYSQPGVEACQFHYECFDRKIHLPANVDTEFVSAEYKEGILHIHMPKTKGPVQRSHSRIVVY
ncbi:MAG: Hsp20/alpha crystallin family protein [Bacteroidota bacterium]